MSDLKIIQENKILKKQLEQYRQVIGYSCYMDDSTLRGGLRVVKTIDERDLIDCCHRKQGMIVVVVGSDYSYKEYRLLSNTCENNWEEISSGGGGIDPSKFVTIDTDQTIIGNKIFTKPIGIEEDFIGANKSKKLISFGDKLPLDKDIKDGVFQGHNVFTSIEGLYEPSIPTGNSRYVGIGTDVFPNFLGNTAYRPGHPAHDSWVGIGSNLGFGVEDGTNITLVGTTLFYRNDVKLWDSVTAIGKGITNARPPFNDPNRVVTSVDGFNLRDMMSGVYIAGNEHWFGDIHTSTVVGTSTKNWKYIFNSIVLGTANETYNPDNDSRHANNFLDGDVVIGNGLWKNLDRYADSYNLIIGNTPTYGIGSWDRNYIPLVEGNFRNPFFRINGLFNVNDSNTKITNGSDSILIHSSYNVTGDLRGRTYISGKNNFNADIHTSPLTGAGGFIASGMNNFPLLTKNITDSLPDGIDSIYVYGQRNGAFHNRALNLWSFGTAGHINYSNPFKDVYNFGVLGVGSGLTAPVVPIGPTGIPLNYNERVINVGNNYNRHIYNSLTIGINKGGSNIMSDSIFIGNENAVSGFTRTTDRSIVIGHNIYTESTVSNYQSNFNFVVGMNGVEFLSGFYGAGQKYTKLRGRVDLEDKLRLANYTKVQVDALTSNISGDIVYQTDNTPGIRIYNGSTWERPLTSIPVSTDTVLGGVKEWYGTQAQYNAIVTKQPDVKYYIEKP